MNKPKLLETKLLLGSITIFLLSVTVEKLANAYPVVILKKVESEWQKYCSAQLNGITQVVTTAKHCLEKIDIADDEVVYINLEELEAGGQRIIPLDKSRITYPEIILTEKQIKKLKPSNLRVYGFRMEKKENILRYFLRLAIKAEKEFQDTNIVDIRKLDNFISRILSMTRSNNFHGLIAGNSGSALECLVDGKIYRAGVLSYAGFYKSKSAYVVGFALNGGKFLELRLTLNNDGGFVESLHYVDELSD